MALSDTAYSCCIFRSLFPEVSGDIYAKEWINEESMQNAKKYTDHWLAEVSRNEDIAVSMRCSYFLNQLKQAVEKDAIGSFFNIGAGFTSYPLLLSNKIDAFEFDLAEVIEVKKQRLDEITKRHSGNILTIPSLIAGDITDIRTLENALSRIQDKPVFYIMEGLSYYLSFDNFKAVFALLKDKMAIGEKIAIDFWSNDYINAPVFLKQAQFFGETLDISDRYLFLDEEDLNNIDGFEITDTSSALLEASKRGLDIQNMEFLPENYCVLTRI
ncbi:MAG: hypothetical protein CMH32_05810 [Micavibrio sp.]|nr:hypothetical protein [Micavibrio sp.]